MDADVLAEFECVCAESRRMLRTGCTDCDLCYYYTNIDLSKIAESNPWSYFEPEPEPQVNLSHVGSEQPELLDIYEGLNMMGSVSPRPFSATSDYEEMTLPVIHDTFDDSLILPTTGEDEDLDASIARRKAAINEKLFRIGIVPGWSDPVSTYGPYEANRSISVKRSSTPSRRLSLRRPKKTPMMQPKNGISMDLYDQFIEIPNDNDYVPPTPELDSPSSLKRTSTDVSEGSLSEDELEFAGPQYDPVIRRISASDQQMDEFADLYPQPLKPKSRRVSYYGEVTAMESRPMGDMVRRHNTLLHRPRPSIHL